MVMESLLVEGSSTIQTLGSFDRSMFLPLVISKPRLVDGHKIAARMDTFEGLRGISLCNLQVVIPGTLTTVMLMAQCGSVGLALRPDLVSLSNDQKQPACKTDLKRKSHSLFHAKSKCRIACWNV